jgi:lipopolysaccharide export system permease protein
VLSDDAYALTCQFDSMRLRPFVETPDALLIEPKKPEQMRYAELGSYIDALERSGGDGRKLRVGRALKIAVPVTGIIIALFAAPLVTAAPKAGGALGVALGLGTTIIFLTMVQLSRALGGSGLVSPTLAAWLPNIAFGTAGLWMLKRVRT